MVRLGFFLGSEEHNATDLVDMAVRAERGGFDRLWISDHFHPWLDRQGESPFVWSVIGAIAGATGRVGVTTAVTCPTVRIHPVVVAQAAATCAQLLDGRFALGVGSGEALNEHILGDRWPPAGIRLQMLSEAVSVIRRMWTGESVTHHGTHYTVENARLYTLPAEPPPIYVSGFGPKSVRLAAQIGDGYISTMPDADLLRHYRTCGGGGPAQGGLKVCWHEDADEAVRTAFEIWPNDALPGQLAQDLPTPAHFAQASQLVRPEMVAESVPCGPDPETHIEAVRRYVDAGFDEVYVQQIGSDQQGMIDFYAREVLPEFR